MSFVSDELANVLKSVYMKEESGRDEDANCSSNVDKNDGDDVSKEKHSKKHKHKKHSSKAKSRDKKKHKKRKHKSRSRSRSESRSRSRSRSSEREHSSKPSKRRSTSANSRSKSPDEIVHDDFILEKEKYLDKEGKDDKSDKEGNDLKSKEAGKTTASSEADLNIKPEGTCDSNCQSKESILQRPSSEERVVSLDASSTAVKEEKDRLRSRSQSKEKGTYSKRKKSSSHSRSRSKSPDNKSSGTVKNRQSRSHSRSRKMKRKSNSRSSSKESLHRKKSRSRSCSRNRSTKRKSRSRSKGRNRKRSVSRSRSRSYSKSKSRSPRRKRSHSRSRRRSPVFRNFRRYSPPRWKRGTGSFRQRRRSTSRSRRSRSRRRSYSRRRQSRSRSNSRSNSRLRNRRRSPSRSWGRRSHSRSKSHLQNRRSQSISRGRRKRSGSRSRSYSKGRGRTSTSKDRNKSKSKSRSRSKSKEKPQPDIASAVASTSTAVGNKATSITDKPVVTNLSTQQVKVAQRAGGKTIAELTAFCKKLQEEREGAENGNKKDTKTEEEEEESQPVAHHPFLVKEKPDITIPPVIFPVNMNKPSMPTVDPNKPLQEQFPVSCGSKHREKEVVDDGVGIVANVDGCAIQTQPQNEVFAPPPAEKFDISELVAKRMDAQRRLQSDPNDIDALLILQEIQMKMQNWCQSNVKPGQFTGELVKNLLPKEHLQGGYQAWAKKDMFHNLAPVTGGIGMKLLQKMGWKPGQVIGKRGEGHAEPIPLTVKIDRKGLSAGKEKATKKGPPTMLDLQGKHPVSALAEYCSKRKWQLPDYSLIFDHGPAHHKQFLFKVLVNSTEYQPAVVCGNKKQAKAQAAIFALKGLGLIPEDADISAL